ncbi:MAG: lysylphosphatidylglycerol synthase transmembrane domain-containing protein [Nanoarchaeota archaeon]
MHEKQKKLWVIALLAIGLIGLVIIFIQVPPSQVIRTFRHAKPLAALMFLASSVMVMVAFSFRWHLILRAHGYKVSVWNLLKYRVCGYGIGAMTPTAKVGGEPVRMMLLARHGIPPMKRVSSVLTDKIVEISTNVFFFLIGLILVLVVIALPLKTEIIIICLMIILIFLIFLFYYHIFSERYFFTRIFRLLHLHKMKRLKLFEYHIKEMEKIMIDYHMQHRKNFYIVILISSLGWIFTLLQLHFALTILGITTATLSQLFIILIFIGLAFLFPIPLAVGSLEALQISSFALLRLGPSASAVAMSFLIRTLDLFWILLALVFLGSMKLNIVKIFTRSLKTVDEELTEVKLKQSGASVKIIRHHQKTAEPRKPSAITRWITAHKKKRREAHERKKQEHAAKEREEHLFSYLTKKR